MSERKRRPRIQIQLDEFGKGSIAIDGEPVKGVSGLTIVTQAGEPATVTLRFVAYGVEIQAPADVLALLDDPRPAEGEVVDLTTTESRQFRDFGRGRTSPDAR